MEKFPGAQFEEKCTLCKKRLILDTDLYICVCLY